MPVATKREILVCIAVSLTIGIIFAFEFIPLSYVLGDKLTLLFRAAILREAGFPILAFLFYISLLPKKISQINFLPLLKTVFIPLIISLSFGKIVNTGNVVPNIPLWEIFFAPVGEELIFRGWLFELMKRISKGRFFTSTNPMPISSITSSIAFSIWHIQNISIYGIGFTSFQLLYTFLIGIWFSYLRSSCGTILCPVIAHIVINIASLIL